MKRGDVVRPKGRKRPLMTVASVSTTGIVHCLWFDSASDADDGKLHRDNFSRSELRVVKRASRRGE